MSAVPKFLEAWDTPDTAHLPYQNAIFMHKPPIGPVHALWWPCRQIGSAPDVVLLFIPGKFIRNIIPRTLNNELGLLQETQDFLAFILLSSLLFGTNHLQRGLQYWLMHMSATRLV